MGLKGILSISGMPGLYKVLAQTKTGFIVESLSDKKRLPVSSTQRISMLDDISVYSTHDDIPLKEVLLKIKTFSDSSPVADPNSDPAKLRTFFKSVIPDYDDQRVYPSHIKKIITWYHLVKDVVEQPDEQEETDNNDQAETDHSAGSDTTTNE